MIYLYICGAVFLIGCGITVYSICTVSGRASRREEAEQLGGGYN